MVVILISKSSLPAAYTDVVDGRRMTSPPSIQIVLLSENVKLLIQPFDPKIAVTLSNYSPGLPRLFSISVGQLR